jgi:hypothetical protein
MVYDQPKGNGLCALRCRGEKDLLEEVKRDIGIGPQPLKLPAKQLDFPLCLLRQGLHFRTPRSLQKASACRETPKKAKGIAAPRAPAYDSPAVRDAEALCATAT